MKNKIQPWNATEAAHYRATARQCFQHSYDHGSTPDPDNCGGCAIRGLGTEDGKPNYAGWARCYVESGQPIPKGWKADFNAELRSENTAYAMALKRSIETFGMPIYL